MNRFVPDIAKGREEGSRRRMPSCALGDGLRYFEVVEVKSHESCPFLLKVIG